MSRTINSANCDHVRCARCGSEPSGKATRAGLRRDGWADSERQLAGRHTVWMVCPDCRLSLEFGQIAVEVSL